MSGITTIIGNRGEDIATEWLRERGYYIVERNWRAGRYEIDIIAQHYDTLHFVEVKTRKEGGWESAYDSIDDQKIRTLRRGATAYRAIHGIHLDLQFDLIAVTWNDNGDTAVEYTENIM
ncbi:MAG: YraN family protein [Alistipes sp.]|jgi:putative endonuclease|nr:YraN family protein [Alistipes sp.]